jgi:hypothetical protein
MRSINAVLRAYIEGGCDDECDAGANCHAALLAAGHVGDTSRHPLPRNGCLYGARQNLPDADSGWMSMQLNDYYIIA